jgi:lipopolysaccharide export system permease protein
MNQIERYIFRRIFVLSIGTLVVTTVLAMTTQILLYVNVLTSTSQSLMAYLTLAVMLMPKVMTIVMPFALMIGAGQTLSSMNEDSELVVIEATGAPPRTIGKPLLLIAAGMSLFTLFSNNFIEPWSNHHVRDIVSKARGDLLSSAIETGSFTRLDDNVYFSVANVGRGGELQGIFISDARDKNTEFTYYAKAGTLVDTADAQLLVMADGQMQRKNTHTGTVSIVEFKSYALDLALFPGGTQGTNYYPKERPTSYLFHPDPSDPYFKDRPDLFVQEIHKRFSQWLYPLLFGLIAMSFMGKAHSNRSDRMQYDVLAFLVALAYRGFGFYAEPEAGLSTLFAYLCYAVPLFGIAFYSMLILMERQISLPRAWIDGVSHGYDRLASLVRRVPWPASNGGRGR